MIMLKVPKNRVSLSLSLSLSLSRKYIFGKSAGGGGVVKAIPPALLELKCRVPVYPLLYIWILTKHLEIGIFVEVQLFCEGFKLVSLPKLNYKKLLVKSLRTEFSQKFLQWHLDFTCRVIKDVKIYDSLLANKHFKILFMARAWFIILLWNILLD